MEQSFNWTWAIARIWIQTYSVIYPMYMHYVISIAEDSLPVHAQFHMLGTSLLSLSSSLSNLNLRSAGQSMSPNIVSSKPYTYSPQRANCNHTQFLWAFMLAISLPYRETGIQVTLLVTCVRRKIKEAALALPRCRVWCWCSSWYGPSVVVSASTWGRKESPTWDVDRQA